MRASARQRVSEAAPGVPRLVLGMAGAAGLVLAALSGADAFVGVTRARAPTAALRVHPNDALARANAADQAFLAAPADERVRAASEQAARASLRGSLLNPVAVRLAALGLERGGSDAKLLGALDAGQRLTRHDAATQLLLIEANVAQGNVSGALTGYDHVLRRKPEMGETLFPILATAARDRGVLPDLRRLLGVGAPWVGYFIDWAISNDRDLGTLLPAITAAPTTATGLSEGRRQNLVKQLAALRDYPAAAAAYRRFDQAPDQGGRADFARPSRFAPFDWEVQNGPGIDGAIDAKAGLFHFTLLGDGSGLLLRRLIAVRPGPHRLDLAGTMVGPAAALVAGRVTCAQTGAQLGTLGLRPNSPAGVARIVDVPRGCAFVWLALEGKTTPEDAVEGRLSRFRLMPATGGARSTDSSDQDPR